jgi:acetyl-CoA C-acetyltransferase
MRKRDCSQITDGGAMVILSNHDSAIRYARSRGLDVGDIPYIQGWGHTTGPITLEAKWDLAAPEGLLFPHLHQAISDSMRRAGIRDAFELDAIETHDCFTSSAYMAIDHFGLTPPGQNGMAIDEGWLFREGRLPMNPSGGLIGGGHPVGATGVRMVLDAFKQVTGTADGYQVEGCGRVGTLNIGGSATTCVSFMIGSENKSKKQ